MKVLWLSHLIPYPPKGGVLQRSYYLIKEVAKYHDVDLLAFNQPDLLRGFFETQEQGKNEAVRVLSKFCNSVKFFDITSEKYKYGKYFLALKSIFTTDPYNINWLKSNDFTIYLKKILNDKYPSTILDVHY